MKQWRNQIKKEIAMKPDGAWGSEEQIRREKNDNNKKIIQLTIWGFTLTVPKLMIAFGGGAGGSNS